MDSSAVKGTARTQTVPSMNPFPNPKSTEITPSYLPKSRPLSSFARTALLIVLPLALVYPSIHPPHCSQSDPVKKQIWTFQYPTLNPSIIYLINIIITINVSYSTEAQQFNDIYFSYIFFVGSTQKNHEDIFSNPENSLNIHITADTFKRKARSTVCKSKDWKHLKTTKMKHYPASK